jgi:hypothetical protein
MNEQMLIINIIILLSVQNITRELVFTVQGTPTPMVKTTISPTVATQRTGKFCWG